MRAKAIFRAIIQDSQNFGSDDQHMVSRVFFDLDIAGRIHTSLYVDVKQIVGSDFKTAPLEVGPPHSYSGPFNHEEFAAAVQNYYRSAFGPTASVVGIADGSQVRMWDNLIIRNYDAEFEVAQEGGGW